MSLLSLARAFACSNGCQMEVLVHTVSTLCAPSPEVATLLCAVTKALRETA